MVILAYNYFIIKDFETTFRILRNFTCLSRYLMSLDCCNSYEIELFVELIIEAHDLFELPYMVNIKPTKTYQINRIHDLKNSKS